MKNDCCFDIFIPNLLILKEIYKFNRLLVYHILACFERKQAFIFFKQASPFYNSVRFSMARSKVTSSAYSISDPTANPRASRVTLMVPASL